MTEKRTFSHYFSPVNLFVVNTNKLMFPQTCAENNNETKRVFFLPDSVCCGDSPQPLQALQHVPLDGFVLLVTLQQRDGIIVVLAVDLVHLF